MVTKPTVLLAPKKYELCEIVGRGSYGVVWRATEVATQKKVAIKAIKRTSLMTADSREQFAREVGALAVIRHARIVSFKECYEDASHVYIVTELCGQELYERIVEKSCLPESQTKQICHQILQAVGHLHQRGFVHRDIKPENFCIEHRNQVKLIDFGLCCRHQNQVMENRCGSYFYVAPEVLDREYTGGSCDVWSVGVVLFVMLVGYPPFYGETDEEIAEQVKTAEPDLSQERWHAISDQAKDLVLKLLVKDPTRRITAAEALGHTWFEEIVVATTAPKLPVPCLSDSSKRRRSRSLELRNCRSLTESDNDHGAINLFVQRRDHAQTCTAAELSLLQSQLQQCSLQQVDPASRTLRPQPPQKQKQTRSAIFRRSFRRKTHRRKANSIAAAP